MEQQKKKKEEEGWQLLKKITVAEELVRGSKRLVQVPYTASVIDTLNVLLANNILAVPVAAPPGEWVGAGGSMILESEKATGTLRKQYIGMISAIDILMYIAECEQHDSAAIDDLEAYLMATPVSNIFGYSVEDLSLWCVTPTTSVLDVLEPFSKGIRRALVPDETETERAGLELQEASPGYKMLTQMDIVQFLQMHSNQLKFFTASSVGELGAVQTGAFAASADMTVGNVLKAMRKLLLNAVPIVEALEDNLEPALIPGKGRKLIGTFSATDLRGCPASKLRSCLSLNVLEFTEKLSRGKIYQSNRPAALDGASPDPRHVITCHMNSPLEEVLSKVVDYHVHRVWVVDQNDCLVGLVALTDILRAVYTAVLIEQSSSEARMHPD